MIWLILCILMAAHETTGVTGETDPKCEGSITTRNRYISRGHSHPP